MKSRLPSGTLTLLFTDIEGSTRLLHDLGDRYVELLADHRRLIREAVAAHGGVEVDSEGDAFFVVFERASDAVAAAGEIQGKLAPGPIRVRIGLHTGEPTLTAEGYVGIDVHKAARIMSAGHGGQVVLSSATRELVRADLRDLGVHRLKDLLSPERLFQLGEGEFPPLRSLNQTNLPVQPTAFLGRERELADVLAMMRTEGVRLLTLTGLGGSGKTRLALQAAAELADAYADGVWFVGCGTLNDPRLAVAATAQTLGLRETAGETLEQTLARHLESKRILLVLDNLEQLIPDVAPWIGELCAAGPGIQVIATSREPLHLAAEHEYAVYPLAIGEAIAVFNERARAVLPEFRVGEENRSTVEAICARVDRLPLAIELAAARVKVLRPDQLLDRLERRLPLLVGGARDTPERHRTLRATIAWSYDLLDDTERALFARLSVFSGGCALGAAESVCEADFETLASLVDKSLVRAEDAHGDSRYVMLETVREFALEALKERADRDESRRTHAAYFAQLVERAGEELKGRDQARWLHELETEHDNLRSALRWLLDNDPELALRTTATLWLFWYVHGHVSEGRAWLREALERAPAVSEARALALDGAGYLAGEQANPEARTLLQEGLECARAVGAKGVAAITLSHLTFYELEDDPELARSLGEEAVALAREVGDRYTLGVALNNLGEVVRAMGDAATATELYDEGYRVRLEVGDSSRIALSLVNLGEMALLAGDRERARSLLSEALDLARQLGDKRHGAFAVSDLGWLALVEGRAEEAEPLLREGLVLAREVGQKQFGLETVKAMAAAAAARGNVRRAARLWGAVTALAESVVELPTTIADIDIHRKHLEDLQRESDPATWETAWREGTAMDIQAAFDEALAED